MLVVASFNSKIIIVVLSLSDKSGGIRLSNRRT